MNNITARLQKHLDDLSVPRDQHDVMSAAANEIETLRADLAKLRLGICEHATDTVWIDDRATTAVDFISMILDDGDWYNDVYLPSKGKE